MVPVIFNIRALLENILLEPCVYLIMMNELQYVWMNSVHVRGVVTIRHHHG